MGEVAMIELTEQQREELDKQRPALVCDPKTNEIYAVLRRDVCDCVRTMVQDVNGCADWDDPAFDVYDRDAS
jgi:hypothetical protein